MTNCIIDSYGISVELPMHDPVAIPANETPEHLFIKRRDREINPSWRKNNDRARALVKYADSCGGKWKRVVNSNGKATFTFEFHDLNMMLAFAKNLKTVVDAASS